MSFLARALLSSSNIYLVLSAFPDERNAWYFIRVKRHKMDLFKKEVTSGPVELTNYGDILSHGWGKYPPEATIEKMRAIYGYQEDRS